MTDVREGSQADLDYMLTGVDPRLAPDPRVDRAFKIFRGPDDTNKVVALEQPKSDEQRAAEYKVEVRKLVESICDVMTAARREGLVLSWQIGWDAAGRAFVHTVDSVKPL